jgi:hypothetical protein
MFRITPAGTKRLKKPYLKYNSIKISTVENKIELLNNGVVVATYAIALYKGDTLNIGGINGKLEVDFYA